MLDSSVMKKTAADSKSKGTNTGCRVAKLAQCINILWQWVRYKFLTVVTIFILAKVNTVP